MIRFKREPQKIDEEKFYKSPVTNTHVVWGHKNIYDWLKKNGLFYEKSMIWQPLQDKDKAQRTPALHKAVLAGDRAAVEKCLPIKI